MSGATSLDCNGFSWELENDLVKKIMPVYGLFFFCCILLSLTFFVLDSYKIENVVEEELYWKCFLINVTWNALQINLITRSMQNL